MNKSCPTRFSVCFSSSVSGANSCARVLLLRCAHASRHSTSILWDAINAAIGGLQASIPHQLLPTGTSWTTTYVGHHMDAKLGANIAHFESKTSLTQADKLDTTCKLGNHNSSLKPTTCFLRGSVPSDRQREHVSRHHQSDDAFPSQYQPMIRTCSIGTPLKTKPEIPHSPKVSTDGHS